MVSQHFKDTILDYISKEANTDPLFKEKFENPKKNIEDCCTYILNQVKKSGQNGFADAEIYGMAIHYYQEENVEVGGKINANVVVNHHLEKPSVKAEKKPVDLFAESISSSQKQSTKPNPPKPKKEPVKVDAKTFQVSLF